MIDWEKKINELLDFFLRQNLHPGLDVWGKNSVVPNVLQHCILFCLCVVCGWALLMKTCNGREKCVYMYVSVLFLNGLLGGLSEVLWLFLLCLLFSPSTARVEQHTCYTGSSSLWMGRPIKNQPSWSPTPLLLLWLLNPGSMLLNFRAESDNLEKYQNPLQFFLAAFPWCLW